MTHAQTVLVALDTQKAAIKQYYTELAAALTAVAAEIGIDGYFQADDGTVYQIVVPEGRFVAFDKVGYIRTRKADEAKGSLSLKKACDAGFKVKE